MVKTAPLLRGRAEAPGAVRACARGEGESRRLAGGSAATCAASELKAAVTAGLRAAAQLQDADLAWVQKELVDKEIKPVWERYLKGVSPVRLADWLHAGGAGGGGAEGRPRNEGPVDGVGWHGPSRLRTAWLRVL